MSHAAPPLYDRTEEDSFLAAIADPWRRELLVWCKEPRTVREVCREFLFVSSKQRIYGLNLLMLNGWLREEHDHYVLNRSAPVRLFHLIGVTTGHPQGDLGAANTEACDAAIAALRRQSCRRMISALDLGSVTFGDLRNASGVPHEDFLVSRTILKNALTIFDEKPFYALTGAGFPALDQWLSRIFVTAVDAVQA